ncbi:MAG TPA: hypothetical protein VFV08_07165, partial [Puia sp.]|nr:hypothetical protein [Puia sp.]
MLKKVMEEYFVFTRKERIGVIVLALLVIVVFLLPLIFNPAKDKNEELAIAAFKDEIAKLQFSNDKDSITEANHLSKEYASHKDPGNLIGKNDEVAKA